MAPLSYSQSFLTTPVLSRLQRYGGSTRSCLREQGIKLVSSSSISRAGSQHLDVETHASRQTQASEMVCRLVASLNCARPPVVQTCFCAPRHPFPSGFRPDMHANVCGRQRGTGTPLGTPNRPCAVESYWYISIAKPKGPQRVSTRTPTFYRDFFDQITPQEADSRTIQAVLFVLPQDTCMQAGIGIQKPKHRWTWAMIAMSPYGANDRRAQPASKPQSLKRRSPRPRPTRREMTCTWWAPGPCHTARLLPAPGPDDCGEGRLSQASETLTPSHNP